MNERRTSLGLMIVVLGLVSGCGDYPANDPGSGGGPANGGNTASGGSGTTCCAGAGGGGTAQGGSTSTAGTGGSTSSAGGASGTGGSSGTTSGGSGGTGGTPYMGGDCSTMVPGEFLDLSNWKITLPINGAEEIDPPDILDYSIDPWFHLNAACDAVLFRANCGGDTTGGSEYPRSELREIGSDTDWSTTSGTNIMIVTEAVMHLPAEKSEVVAAQIHDGGGDVMMVRLDGSKLYVEADGNDKGTLDSSYDLGTFFTVKIDASGGSIKVYYNDMSSPKVTFDAAASGCYFKVGDYTQSNTSTGCDADDYGEVAVKSVSVMH